MPSHPVINSILTDAIPPSLEPTPASADGTFYPARSPILSHPPSPTCYREQTSQTSQSTTSGVTIHIAVMGVTGAGKSNFIKVATTNTDVEVHDSLVSRNQAITEFRCRHPSKNYEICFVDTPGFDPTDQDEFKALDKIAKWLLGKYKAGTKLSGVLYMHRITDNRMPSSAVRTLSVFRNICGADAFPNVGLITTHWDDVGALTDQAQCWKREEELRHHFWKPMIEKGSQVLQFDNTFASAWRIIDSLPLDEKAMQIQREMGDQGMALEETSAALSLFSWFWRTVQTSMKRLARRVASMVRSLGEAPVGVDTTDDDDPVLPPGSFEASNTNLSRTCSSARSMASIDSTLLAALESSAASSVYEALSSNSVDLCRRESLGGYSRLSTSSGSIIDESVQIHPSNKSPRRPSFSSPISSKLGTPEIPARADSLPSFLTPAHKSHAKPTSLNTLDDLPRDDRLPLDIHNKCHALVSVLARDPARKALLTELRGEEAQCIVDFLSKILRGGCAVGERRPILHLLSRLAKSAQVFPKYFELPEVRCEFGKPRHEGGYGLVYQGKFRGQVVCVKAVRQFQRSGDESVQYMRVSLCLKTTCHTVMI
ncbi:hypothetical protein AN958_03935 [Leucoagaricus sp. SymC.cos]|nr:hypothetical protein AN958_03935 [Leucoagaricus sp. SymC.cos]